MANLYYNPQPGSTATAVLLTEAQWKLQISKWVDFVDILESQLIANVGVQWFRAPDGDYWADVNAAAPPAFTPTGSNVSNPNLLTTANTVWSANTPP